MVRKWVAAFEPESRGPWSWLTRVGALLALAACGGGDLGLGSAGGAGGSGGVPCQAAADCPAPESECQAAACLSGGCALEPKPEGAVCDQGAGTCDGAGQCNVCEPGYRVCSGSTLLACGESGTFDDPITCEGDTPYCDPADPKCVECFDTSQCIAPGLNPCLAVACLDHACATTLVPDGSACLVAGETGTCSGGVCQLCMPGTKACSGDTLLVCGPDGLFDASPCGGATPFCDPAALACVECLDAAQCASPASPCAEAACAAGTCGLTFSGDGVACALGGELGTCDGAGQCNLCEPGTKACGGNAVLTCGPNGQLQAPAACGGATPYCEPVGVACVACLAANQCPAPAGACQVAQCAGNACGIASAPNGTACSVGADAGTCQGGACAVCTNGQTRCKAGAGAVPQLCVGGLWVDQAACLAATQVCDAGACVPLSCGAGLGNCDANAANGCETNVLTSAAHCGACNAPCAAGSSCLGGVCTQCTTGTLSELTKAGGKESQGSFVVDLDGDGFQDPVWTNQLDQTATVFWGNGLAQFPPTSTTFAVGRTAAYAAFGDLNGDGRKDVVTSNQDYNSIRVAMQTANRVFAAPTTIAQSGFPQWVTLLDANRDGKLDLLVSTPQLGCWTLRLGDGVGGFAPGACLAGMPSTNGFARAGDLDGDGWAELVWGDYPGTQYIIVKLTAAGAVQGTLPVAVAGYPVLSWLDLVDLNQDGKLDLVHSGKTAANAPWTVVIQYNQGGLVFSPCTFGSSPGANAGFSFGDLNGDKKPEYTRSTTCSFCNSTYYLGVSQ